jgi:hypothetical protein
MSVEEVVVRAKGSHGSGLHSLLAEAGVPEAAKAVFGDVALETKLHAPDTGNLPV